MCSDVLTPNTFEHIQTHPNTSKNTFQLIIFCRRHPPIATIHLLHTTTMAPSAMVHPAASGHFSITMPPINTKFKGRIEDKSFNRLE